MTQEPPGRSIEQSQPRSWGEYVVAGFGTLVTFVWVIAGGVRSVGTIMSGFAQLLMILVGTLIAAALMGWAAVRASTPIAVVPAVLFPVMTLVWLGLSFKMPGTLKDGPRPGPRGELWGDYPAALGSMGLAIVCASMISVLLVCWLWGDRRIRWYVWLPVAVVVGAAHAVVITWLAGRPYVWE